MHAEPPAAVSHPVEEQGTPPRAPPACKAMKRTTIKKILLVQGGLGDSVGPRSNSMAIGWPGCRTAKNALDFIQKDLPALVVIDVPSLRVSAERLCQSIKRLGDVPIVMIGPEQSASHRSRPARCPALPAPCADAYIPPPDPAAAFPDARRKADAGGPGAGAALRRPGVPAGRRHLAQEERGVVPQPQTLQAAAAVHAAPRRGADPQIPHAAGVGDQLPGRHAHAGRPYPLAARSHRGRPGRPRLPAHRPPPGLPLRKPKLRNESEVDSRQSDWRRRPRPATSDQPPITTTP